MNNLAISAKKFFTNKNTITIIGVVAILVILYVMYTKTIDDATKKVTIPVAAKTINPQTQITAEDIKYIEVAKAAQPDGIKKNDREIVGMYTGVGCTIPEGSMFYNGVLVLKEDLPGNWLTLLEKNSEGELQKPYYFAVNTTTTYGNSIQPDDYVDFYVRTYGENETLMFGKLLSNIKILAVTDSQGKDVFRSTQDVGQPAYLNIGVYSDVYDLLKKAEYLNETDIELIVVPHGGAVKEEDLKVNVDSDTLKDFIQNKAFDLETADKKAQAKKKAAEAKNNNTTVEQN